jgi:hypothetical protein
MCIKFSYPFEQEVGSAGEQPISDKVDVYTIERWQTAMLMPFLIYIGNLHG